MYILSVSVVIKTYSTHPVSVTRPLLIRGTADLGIKGRLAISALRLPSAFAWTPHHISLLPSFRRLSSGPGSAHLHKCVHSPRLPHMLMLGHDRSGSPSIPEQDCGISLLYPSPSLVEDCGISLLYPG
jgi:hypothetical protein